MSAAASEIPTQSMKIAKVKEHGEAGIQDVDRERQVLETASAAASVPYCVMPASSTSMAWVSG